MVASRHASSPSAGASSLDRPNGSRSHLRLVVDNTSYRSTAGAAPESRQVRHHRNLDMVLEEPGSFPVEVGAWLQAVASLAAARWRLARQRLVNLVDRHGLPGASRSLAGLVPSIVVAAVLVFGALFGLRLMQESSSGSADNAVGSVGSVAASTSDTVTDSVADQALGTGSTVIVVHPGDSLWSIAVERFPEHDPRKVVDAFVELNGAAMIQSGQQLLVPAALDRN